MIKHLNLVYKTYLVFKDFGAMLMNEHALLK